MTKLFTVVGRSYLEGQGRKLRFANNVESRRKTLIANDHTDILLMATPEPMTKMDAAVWFGTQDIGPVDMLLVTDYVEKNTPKPAKPRGRPRKETATVSEAEATEQVDETEEVTEVVDPRDEFDGLTMNQLVDLAHYEGAKIEKNKAAQIEALLFNR